MVVLDAYESRVTHSQKSTQRKSISTYTYDSANKLLEEDNNQTGITTYSYDSDGNLTAKKGATSDFTYEYSVESRLKAVRTQGALLMAVSYDGDGNRTFEVDRKVVPFGISQSSLSQQNASTSTDADSTDNTNLVDSGSHLTSTETSRAAGDSETTSTATPVTKNFTTKQYVDPSKTVFWYGFGQGILQLGSSLNQALTVDLSNWFSDAWNSITGQYKLIMRSDNSAAYSAKDIKALKVAGLTDDEAYDVTHPVVIPSGDDSQQSGGTNAGSSADAAAGQSNGINNLPITIPSFPGEDNRIDYDLTYYVNDTNTTNTQVLAAYGATNTLTADYAYGADGRISTQTPGKSSDYYLPDGRGSVSDLTDSAGKVLTHYTYDPSGQVTSGALPQTTDLGYNGEEYDSTTGLQYLRARYYDPQMAHFGVQDTAWGNLTSPASLNLYNYAQSNPVNFSDPSGHSSTDIGVIGSGNAFTIDWLNEAETMILIDDPTYSVASQLLYGNTTAYGGYAEDQRYKTITDAVTQAKKMSGMGSSSTNNNNNNKNNNTNKNTGNKSTGNKGTSTSKSTSKTQVQESLNAFMEDLRRKECEAATAKANGNQGPAKASQVTNTNASLTPAQLKVNARYIAQRLLLAGWSKEAIAAALGNMESESSLNPGAWQWGNGSDMNSGFGIVQWTPATKLFNWANAHSMDPYSIETQVDLLVIQASSNDSQWTASNSGMSFADFTHSTPASGQTTEASVDELARNWMMSYEKPKTYLVYNKNPTAANKATFDNAATQRGNQAWQWYTFLFG